MCVLRLFVPLFYGLGNDYSIAEHISHTKSMSCLTTHAQITGDKSNENNAEDNVASSMSESVNAAAKESGECASYLT